MKLTFVKGWKKVDLSFAFFWKQVLDSQALMITVFLTLCVIFVNGWTDAPNAIATCVSTRSMDVDLAIVMAAVCNFAGVIVMTMINSTVAMTITNMVNFWGNNYLALTALCAALFAIVAWAVLAWYFGIPTSESHALIAGISGAAIAMQGGIGGINGSEWIKVIHGLGLSTVLGFALGFAACKLVSVLCGRSDRRRMDGFFRGAQIAGAAAMAFMHGAQDGQKFLGVLLLGICLAGERDSAAGVRLPIWMMLLCSLVMGTGTALGGKKIIKSVGMDMVKLEKYQGFSADLAGAFCLFLSSVLGIPVSTTHTKTTAIMGVGAVKRLSAINFQVVKEMMLTWVLTFPGCGAIGFLMAKLFMAVFQ